MNKEIKQKIKEAIQQFNNGNLTENVISLFQTLGYNTERQQPFEEKTYACFKEFYLDNNNRFNEEKALVPQWNYIDLLFQLSRDEISPQLGLFDTKQVDRTIIETYLFFVIELCEESYSRTALSQITREINKVFPMPVMVLFRHGKTLTLSVINRRLHKRDEQKDVLEKVTLIKDISTEKPHRAHIEILFDISFDKLLRVHKFSNFVELHKAWQETLNIKELNKRFYKELSNWYFWAMRNVYFPGASPDADKKAIFQKDEKIREHNAKNLIRLLTRILFIWFTKEKNLIPDELFDESFIKDNLLKSFEPRRKNVPGPQSQESKYYRAILQNLFFATLNQTVGKREFRKSGQHMNVTNLMRYESYFKNKKTFLALVEKTVPFMNGGLFECLDKPSPDLKGKRGGDVIVYEDGFSDRPDNELCVPDYIFFGISEHADLSEELGSKSKDVEVKGLLNIFNSYKFTITENTPIEEDIALDPELLGKVFENLLASYNPETKTTARKQTGSFYTPPEIVNYMVDESLTAYLKHKMDDAGVKDKETDLRDMISYSENPNPFSKDETAVLIEAIDTCKILDPACGSGAFPMGILHKLVHILDKLDPKNKLWKERQIQKASVIDDAVIRDQLIEDIETAFNNNELDYGRKLYLIENCIYGVDIQPIASQISKLRCFISLIVDQRVDKTKDNFGVRPLPNLETKFVAANTLIGIEKPKDQLVFSNPELNKLEKQIKDVRHRLFSAKTPVTKRKLREDDKTLREKMGDLLIDSGWENKTASQLASWDPYDQNASSPFFDTEWMFGLTHGFDVVLGNPPYFNISTISKDLYHYLAEHYKIIHTGYNDIVYYFIYLGIELLNKNGCCTLITSNYYLGNEYAKKLRLYLKDHTSKIINFKDYMVFDAASIHTCISFSYKNTKSTDVMFFEATTNEKITSSDIEAKLQSFAIKRSELKEYWLIANQLASSIIGKLNNGTVLLGDISTIKKGATSGNRDIFTVLKSFAEENKFENELLKTSINSKDIKRYLLVDSGEYLIYVGNNTNIKNYPNIYKYLLTHQKVLSERNEVAKGVYPWYRLERPRKEEVFEANEKLVVPYRAESNMFAFDNKQGFNDGGGSYAIAINDGKINIKYVLALLNSKLINWFYGFIGKPKGKAREYFNKPLSLIPIKKISSPDQQPFITLANQILTITKDDDYLDNTQKQAKAKALEAEIDQLMYKLYNLTDKEIKIIEKNNIHEYDRMHN
jgi:adenine-specific DNA-methyltransferase